MSDPEWYVLVRGPNGVLGYGIAEFPWVVYLRPMVKRHAVRDGAVELARKLRVQDAARKVSLVKVTASNLKKVNPSKKVRGVLP